MPRRMTTLLKMELLLCRFLELEYKLPPRDFHPPKPSHYLTPRLYFLLYVNYGYYSPYTNLILPLPHIQLNQYQLDLLSGLVLSPLCTTSHIVLEDILLSLHSHAIDNEHSALVLWTYNLFDCRQLLPLTSRLVALVSGLAFISPLCMLVLP